MTKKLLAVAISAALMSSVGFANTAYADEGAHSFPSQCWHPSQNVLKPSAYNHPGVCDEAIAHWESEHQGETSEEEGEVEEGEVEEGEAEEGEVEEGEAEEGEAEEGEAEEGESEGDESEEGEVEEGEVEIEVEITVEQVVANIVETELNAEEAIQALNEAGLTIADLSEELQQQLPITADPVAIIEAAEETAEEGIVEESEENNEDGESEVEETEDGESEVEETEDGESEVEETEDGESEVEETEDGEPEVEENSEPLEPSDVDEPTFSEELTEEEITQIEEQLEVVEEVIVGTDEEGNDITTPVENVEVIGEVLVPSNEEGDANADVFGTDMSIEAELGTAVAAIEGDETFILTTVTNLEIGEITEEVSVEEEVTNTEEATEEKSISLDFDEAGNIILTLRELKIGDLTVNVKLRALTDTFETYQVEEVTVAPEDVFDVDESASEEVVEESEPALEEVVEPAEVVEESEPALEEVVEPESIPVPENTEV